MIKKGIIYHDICSQFAIIFLIYKTLGGSHEVLKTIWYYFIPDAVGMIDAWGLGRSVHAIGTAEVLELGEIGGAMNSLSIVVADLFTVVGASIFAQLL